MKNLILALAVATLPVVAHAQKSYSNGESAYDQNYKVCRIDGTYTVCSENTPTIVNTKKAAAKNDKTITQLHKLDRYVYVNPEPKVVTSSKHNSHFSASYDDPNAAYQGKESAINDGVDKNISRNINYINNNSNLPPNDGGNSDKR